MSISSYPNGFTNGVTIRGLPIGNAQPGHVWFANNSTILAPGGIAGSDLGPGTYVRPFKTIEGAVNNGKLTSFAGRGDYLLVMPNHAETVSNATLMALATAGVGIIGMGTGAERPAITLDTATTSTITINAASMSIANMRFIANFAAIAALFTVTAKDFYLGNCDFVDTSSILNFVNIVKTSATSNVCDGLFIDSCNFYGLGASSNTCFVNALGTHDRFVIQNNYVAHAATTVGGFMQIASGKALTNLQCINNVYNGVGNSTASNAVFILAGGSGNSGVLKGNFAKTLCDTTPVMVTAASGLRFSQNYYASNADKSGFLLPALDS